MAQTLFFMRALPNVKHTHAHTHQMTVLDESIAQTLYSMQALSLLQNVVRHRYYAYACVHTRTYPICDFIFYTCISTLAECCPWLVLYVYVCNMYTRKMMSVIVFVYLHSMRSLTLCRMSLLTCIMHVWMYVCIYKGVHTSYTHTRVCVCVCL